MQFPKDKWTIAKTRSLFNKIGKILGDVNSLKRGSVGSRVKSRVVGNAGARFCGMISKSIM